MSLRAVCPYCKRRWTDRPGTPTVVGSLVLDTTHETCPDCVPKVQAMIGEIRRRPIPSVPEDTGAGCPMEGGRDLLGD